MSTHFAGRAPDQYCLFETGIDLSELREEKEAFVKRSKAPNTLKAYAHCWQVFSDWCMAAGKPSFPASSDTVEMFLTWGARRRGYRVETLKLQVSAIRDMHQSAGLASPVDDSVRVVLSGIVRAAREELGGKQALRVDQLRRICCRLSDVDPIDVRNRALVLLGFASAWRRSELSGLRLQDVGFASQGVRLWLPQSKGDQDGNGEVTEVYYAADPVLCPVLALKRWLVVRGDGPGPVFLRFRRWGEMTREGISGQVVSDVLKSVLQGIGDDPAMYGAHSMRSGCVTAAAANNVPLVSIMKHTRHKRVDTVTRYVRRVLPFAANPLRGVL